MLVLTRTLDEAVIIGDAVRVSVLGIRGGQVRLGIEAPGHVKIIREELRRRGGGAHTERAPATGPTIELRRGWRRDGRSDTSCPGD
jgi:carbon storage regulator